MSRERKWVLVHQQGGLVSSVTQQEVSRAVVNSSGSVGARGRLKRCGCKRLWQPGVYSRQKPAAALQPRYRAADLWVPGGVDLGQTLALASGCCR